MFQPLLPNTKSPRALGLLPLHLGELTSKGPKAPYPPWLSSLCSPSTVYQVAGVTMRHFWDWSIGGPAALMLAWGKPHPKQSWGQVRQLTTATHLSLEQILGPSWQLRWAPAADLSHSHHPGCSKPQTPWEVALFSGGCCGVLNTLSAGAWFFC